MAITDLSMVPAGMSISDLCVGDAEACLDTEEAIIIHITASIIAVTIEVVVVEFASFLSLSVDQRPVSIFLLDLPLKWVTDSRTF
jgi:hypothetical protein